MRKRIPLNAVRAFEAAARHLSLVKAADELCVTPTAVSHQIRQLEEFLQLKLFLRRNNRLELKPESQVFLDRLSEALDTIDSAMGALGDVPRPRDSLSVGASASLAEMWLMPRMESFLRDEAALDVSILTFLSSKEIDNRRPDLWICNWEPEPDRRFEPLFDEQIVPVCAPQLAMRYGSDALQRIPLVHVDPHHAQASSARYPNWEQYLAEYGVRRGDARVGPRFNQASAAIGAARAGLGAVLGRSVLIQKALATGELVPLGEAYPVHNHYYVVSEWRSRSDSLDRFKDWLFSQAREPQPAPARLRIA